jgi:hypothetical protein
VTTFAPSAERILEVVLIATIGVLLLARCEAVTQSEVKGIAMGRLNVLLAAGDEIGEHIFMWMIARADTGEET